VLTRIADVYRKVHNFTRSSDLYQKVLELDRNNSYALTGLGHLYYEFKDYEKSLYYWSRLAERKQIVDIRVLTSIGNCYRKLKKYMEGKEFFLKALDQEPDNFYALYGIADCYRGMNKHEESLVYWNRILSMDKGNKVILTRLGDAYRVLGELDKATDHYRRALEIDFDIYAEIGLALIEKKKGDTDKALDMLFKLTVKEPRNYRIFLEIAKCYQKQGRKQEAIRILNDFEDNMTGNTSIRNYITELTSS
jgi:tetratricopeptide (TPR) repeat protein